MKFHRNDSNVDNRLKNKIGTITKKKQKKKHINIENGSFKIRYPFIRFYA